MPFMATEAQIHQIHIEIFGSWSSLDQIENRPPFFVSASNINSMGCLPSRVNVRSRKLGEDQWGISGSEVPVKST